MIAGITLKLETFFLKSLLKLFKFRQLHMTPRFLVKLLLNLLLKTIASTITYIIAEAITDTFNETEAIVETTRKCPLREHCLAPPGRRRRITL